MYVCHYAYMELRDKLKKVYGGPTEIARIAGAPRPQNASNWLRRGSVPDPWRRALVDASGGRITLEDFLPDTEGANP